MPSTNLKASMIGVRDQAAAPRRWAVRSVGARNLLTFLMVFGPGLIVTEADNNAGAASTSVRAGAQYGTHLLWILIVLLPKTYFVQEMVVRLGIATGHGHNNDLQAVRELVGTLFSIRFALDQLPHAGDGVCRDRAGTEQAKG